MPIVLDVCTKMNKGRSLPRLEQCNIKKNICLWYVHVYSSVEITEKLLNKKTTEYGLVVKSVKMCSINFGWRIDEV